MVYLKNRRDHISFFKSETKKYAITRYIILTLIILVYFLYTSFKYGTRNGLMVTLLTWSFFVFCTPIADAGFLIDFPIRMLIRVRMIYSELVVWLVALLINIYTYFSAPQVYNKTIILKLFKKILSNPFPLWSIILISAAGTFLSIYFADELIDVSTHKERQKYIKHINKYKLIIFIFVITMAIVFYNFLLYNLGVKIPKF